MKHRLLASAVIAALSYSTAGHARQIYVDNEKPCVLPAACGTPTNPYRSLTEAISKAIPGDEVIVTGHGATKPYYAYDGGALPNGTASALETFVNLSPFIGSTSLPRTVARGVGTAAQRPVIRGSLVFKQGTHWTFVAQGGTSSAPTYLYKMPWTLKRHDAPGIVMEPEQVFRNSLPEGTQQLKQRGGVVFGGYNREAGTTDPDLLAAIAGGVADLWPGYAPLPGKNPANLGANEFYLDRDAATPTLYVMLSNELALGEGLEVSAERSIVQGNGIANVTLQNLTFERNSASSYSRSGAVGLAGTGLVLDNIEIRDADSFCAYVSGTGNTIVNSTFKRCGQVGLVANGSGNTIRYNLLTGNNTRYFSPDWEAGATKFIGNSGGLLNSTIAYNTVLNNMGNGIWLDRHNDGNTIKNNIVGFNEIGIYIENSGDAVLDNNLIFGNRYQGINLRGSPRSTITNNLLVGNVMDGVYMGEQSKTESNYRSTGISISGNVFAWHWEASNKRPVMVTPSTTLFNNRYCGSGAANDNSLHFWLQDWAAGYLYDWSTWRASKTAPNGLTAPAYDTGTPPSIMQRAVAPPTVAGWLTRQYGQAGDASALVNYNGGAQDASSGTAYTRSKLAVIINGSCTQ